MRTNISTLFYFVFQNQRAVMFPPLPLGSVASLVFCLSQLLFVQVKTEPGRPELFPKESAVERKRRFAAAPLYHHQQQQQLQSGHHLRHHHGLDLANPLLLPIIPDSENMFVPARLPRQAGAGASSLLALAAGAPSSLLMKPNNNLTWPLKRSADISGDVLIGGLHMIHERDAKITCGPIMPQGGVQAMEIMLYTIDWVNHFWPGWPKNVTLGAHVLDDCDMDTYGLEMAVDFIKGRTQLIHYVLFSYVCHYN